MSERTVENQHHQSEPWSEPSPQRTTSAPAAPAPAQHPKPASTTRRVEFDLVDASRPGEGIPLIEINAPGIASRMYDPTLYVAPFVRTPAGKLRRRINVHIGWPAYPDVDFMLEIELFTEDCLPITRLDLASHLATAFYEYKRRCEHLCPTRTHAHLAFGPGALNFDHLCLVALYSPDGDVFGVQLTHLDRSALRRLDSRRR